MKGEIQMFLFFILFFVQAIIYMLVYTFIDDYSHFLNTDEDNAMTGILVISVLSSICIVAILVHSKYFTPDTTTETAYLQEKDGFYLKRTETLGDDQYLYYTIDENTSKYIYNPDTETPRCICIKYCDIKHTDKKPYCEITMPKYTNILQYLLFIPFYTNDAPHVTFYLPNE